MEYVITFKNTNSAIKSEQYLAEKLRVSVMPLPSQIRAGCGICLRILPEDIGEALRILDEKSMKETGLYSRTEIGGRYVYDAAADRGVFMGQKLDLLLENCTSGGCGSKISPGVLSKLLSGLPAYHDENLLVGYDSSDDAAVYKLDDKRSIVMTADFFPPMVNDAKTFGKIAAANALSDVYAMGAVPVAALNLVCFPQSMDMAVMKDILIGGAEKVMEAFAVLSGGHSIYDKEPKYGLAVTGIVDTDRIIRNNTPRVSDKLILTKPLGVGIIMAAHRGNMASPESVRKATDSMERLNKYAAEKMRGFSVHACTDVTGFGLLAHALEMVGDGVSILITPEELPYIEEAYAYADDFLITAAGQRNRNHMAGRTKVDILPFPVQELMFDPQTSGGLLISVDPQEAEELLAAIQLDDPLAKIIGEVVKKEKEPILF